MGSRRIIVKQNKMTFPNLFLFIGCTFPFTSQLQNYRSL